MQRQIHNWRGGRREQERSQTRLESAGNFRTAEEYLFSAVSLLDTKNRMEADFTEIVITEHKTMGVSKRGLPKLNLK